MKKLNKKGFTLVELLVVIVIIGILAAVIVPNVASNIDKANQSAAEQEASAAYKDMMAGMDLGKQNLPATVYVVSDKYIVKIVNGAVDSSSEDATFDATNKELVYGTDEFEAGAVVIDTRNGVAYYEATVETNASCGKIPHAHGSDCCDFEAHTHGTDCSCTKAEHTHGTDCTYCNETEHTHGTDCDYSGCEEEHGDDEHTEECCSKTPHTHGTDCSCTKTEHTHGTDCTYCNATEHTHGTDCTYVNCDDEPHAHEVACYATVWSSKSISELGKKA